MVGQHRRRGRCWPQCACRILFIPLWLTVQMALTGCGLAIEPDLNLDRPTLAFPDLEDDILTPASTATVEEELSFTATPAFCCNPLLIQFDVTPKGREFPSGTSFEWDFGDGRTDSGSTAAMHTYCGPGTYVVTLSVRRLYGTLVTAEQVLSLVLDGDSAPDEPTNADLVIESPFADDDEAASPVAHAGSDQTVAPGGSVQLDGTGSTVAHPESTTYSWSQTAGPAVVLGDAESVTPSFIAPQVGDRPVALIFELLVSAADAWSSDTVTISVVQPPAEPADPFPPGMRVVFLSGPEGLAEPGQVEVSWIFTDGVNLSNVILRRDCCSCRDIDSKVLAPDPDGVYRSTIEIPSDGTIWYSVLYTLGGIAYRSQSVYVNPSPRPGPDDAPAVIWGHDPRHDPAILHEILKPGMVTHVLLYGGDRVVHAFDDPNVMETIAICRSAGLKVIWSRFLWNNWGNFQTLDDTVDPPFYATAVEQVRTEADALGADFTAMDCEAYSNALLDDYLANQIAPDEFEAMGAAIRQAAILGQVDYVFPSGAHGRPLHANHLYGPLGRIRIAESTYWDVPNKNCRITYPYDVFGAFVRTTTERPAYGLAPYFLPYDILRRRYLWSRMDGAPETVNGLFLYGGDQTSALEVAAMMAALVEAP